MILVTGGTGFIGKYLTTSLVSLGYPVRLLLNPSSDYPQLPRGVSVEVAISSIYDERNLRAAMKDIDVVFHLVGTEWHGIDADYENVDIPSANLFSSVAKQMNISRFFFLSHIGADKNSAYNYLKAKALAESAIKESGIPYTIIRSGIVYGKGDHFTETIKNYLQKFPFAALFPGGDPTCIQPIWVEDLITCMLLCMDNETMVNQTINVAGSEALPFRDCVELILNTAKIKKRTAFIPPYILRSIYIAYEQWFPQMAKMYFWIDYLAEDRIIPLDVLPRDFGLMPTRMIRNIDYLK